MANQPEGNQTDPIRAVPLDEVRRARGESKIAMPRSKVASLRAFRRVRADRTFGAIGMLLLLIGVALIFSWEKPPVVEKKFGVEWPQSLIRADPFTGELTQGNSATQTFELTVPNATAIIFSLLWTDEIGDQAIEGDELEFSIQGPPGTNVTDATLKHRAKHGNLTIPLGLNGIPDIASVNADTEASARAAVGDRTNRTGMGTWTLRVRLIDAPGDLQRNEVRDQSFCDPNVPPNPYCVPDGRQKYEIHVSYTTYSLRLKQLF